MYKQVLICCPTNKRNVSNYQWASVSIHDQQSLNYFKEMYYMLNRCFSVSLYKIYDWITWKKAYLSITCL